MEYGYSALIVFACLLALSNWRPALYLCLVIDAVRDPIRKLCTDQPVWITIAGAVPWLIVMVSAFSIERAELFAIFRRYPQLKRAFALFIVGLIPGFTLSCVLYRSGYLLAAIGMASYLGPFVGMALGYLFIREEQTITRFLGTYVLINSAMMIGTPLEFLGSHMPGLGGIHMEWIRYRDGYIVNLISGFYRSPDIMGLHAAHIVMFGLILASRARTVTATGWLTAVLWGSICILLCGRRKMIAIPLVFLAAYLLLSYSHGVSKRVRTLTAFVLVAVVAATGLLLSDSQEGWVEYAEYASTTISESPERLSVNIVGGVMGALEQTGLLGAGLGTGTQGRGYLGVKSGVRARGWQEDGLGRLMLEVGIPGFILLMISAIYVVLSLRRSLALVPRETSTRDLQILLAGVVAGNLASFIIAHQHFSGDPVSAILVTLIAGAILGAPRAWAVQQLPRRPPGS